MIRPGHVLFAALLFTLILSPAALLAADPDARAAVIENERSGSALRTVFIQDVKGERMVFIRLTPEQTVKDKLRANVGGDKGVTRLVLRPRQIKALNDALAAEGVTRKTGKVVIRAKTSNVGRHGLKAIYVVRPVSFFAAGAPEEWDANDPITYP